MTNLTLPSVNHALVSDELYQKTIGTLTPDMDLYYKTCVIHLCDAVSRGTISPMEAYEAMVQEYFPINLIARKSAYSNLL